MRCCAKPAGAPHRWDLPLLPVEKLSVLHERHRVSVRSRLRYGAYGLAALGVAWLWVYAFQSMLPAPKALLPRVPRASSGSIEVIPNVRRAGHSSVAAQTVRHGSAAPLGRAPVGATTLPTGRTHSPPVSARAGKPKGPRTGSPAPGGTTPPSTPGGHDAAEYTGRHDAAEFTGRDDASGLAKRPGRFAAGGHTAESFGWRRRWRRRLGVVGVVRFGRHADHCSRRWRTHNRRRTACPVPQPKRSRHECVGGRFQRRRSGNVSDCSRLLGHRRRARHLSDVLDPADPVEDCLGQLRRGWPVHPLRRRAGLSVRGGPRGRKRDPRLGKRRRVVHSSASAFTTPTAPAAALRSRHRARRPPRRRRAPAGWYRYAARLGLGGQQSRPHRSGWRLRPQRMPLERLSKSRDPLFTDEVGVVNLVRKDGDDGEAVGVG